MESGSRKGQLQELGSSVSGEDEAAPVDVLVVRARRSSRVAGFPTTATHTIIPRLLPADLAYDYTAPPS